MKALFPPASVSFLFEGCSKGRSLNRVEDAWRWTEAHKQTAYSLQWALHLDINNPRQICDRSLTIENNATTILEEVNSE
jgi:hypothetical protein